MNCAFDKDRSQERTARWAENLVKFSQRRILMKSFKIVAIATLAAFGLAAAQAPAADSGKTTKTEKKAKKHAKKHVKKAKKTEAAK